MKIRNLDYESSKLNFPRFLNRTTWGKEDFPMRKGQSVRRKNRQRQKRHEQMQARRALARARNVPR